MYDLLDEDTVNFYFLYILAELGIHKLNNLNSPFLPSISFLSYVRSRIGNGVKTGDKEKLTQITTVLLSHSAFLLFD